ncbi:MAG: 30S ribosomal protein S6 [Candidatus Spechtbacterales bacterium]|nr:30S ribosomal protein S6 [Candidatus Spechtbacterales bacterium]
MIPYLGMETTVIKAKNQYELYMLLSPEAISGNISDIENKVSEILQSHGSQIERSDKFSKKDLAYPMKSFGYAYNASIYFFASPDKIEEIKTELKLSDIDFLRIMVTRVQPRKPKKAPRRKAKPKVSEEDLDKAIEKTEKKAEAAEKAKEGKEKSEEKPKKKEEKVKKETDDGVTLDDIDKRLDEIMENL